MEEINLRKSSPENFKKIVPNTDLLAKRQKELFLNEYTRSPEIAKLILEKVEDENWKTYKLTLLTTKDLLTVLYIFNDPDDIEDLDERRENNV